MKRKYFTLMAAFVGFATFLYGPRPALAATAPPLGAVASFSVLGGSTVTNTGPTVVTGDLGLSPGTSVTGFPPGSVVGGSIHQTDALASQAQIDAVTAYNDLAAQPCTTTFAVPTDLGGMTLTPGVYCFASSAAVTGALNLDALGNSNAVWVFKTGSTLGPASGSTTSVTNGGQSCNVFWQVGSSATLGTTSTVPGTIIALTSITLNTGAHLSGRAIARNGAVTLDSNTVGGCASGVVLPGPAAGPTLDFVGLTVLMVLLAGAGLFVMKRSSI
jgi:Ice-binding-like